MPRSQSLSILFAVAVLAVLVAAPPAARAADGSISGTVTEAAGGTPVEGICVKAYPAPSGALAGTTTTDSSGDYTITGLPPSSGAPDPDATLDGYRVLFSIDDCSGNPAADAVGLRPEYAGGSYDRNGGDVIEVFDGADTSGTDAALLEGATISGTVTATDTGSAPPCSRIVVNRAGTNVLKVTFDGSYEVTGLPAETVKVYFNDCDTSTNYADEWWQEQPTGVTATDIVLSPGDEVQGIDFTPSPGGEIRGTVTDEESGAPLEDICIFGVEDGGNEQQTTFTDANGEYVLDSLGATSWKVEFNCDSVASYDPNYGNEWYDGQPSRAAADPISVTGSTTGIDAALAPISAAEQLGALEFVPMTPCAVFDTRNAVGDLAGPIDNGGVATFEISADPPTSQGAADCAGPPAAAVAVELNLVAVLPEAGGNLRVSAAGVAPDGGVVNFRTGVTNSNAVPVALDEVDQEIDVAVNGGPTDVRGVVLGYYIEEDTLSGLEFVPMTPCAVFDTRFGAGSFDGRRATLSTTTFKVAGDLGDDQGQAPCLPPSGEDAVAVVLNLVAVDPLGGGNLRVSAKDVAASGGVVNYVTGEDNSNALSVELAAESVDVVVNGAPTHVRGVVLGYYVAEEGGGEEFVPTTACAVLDTRSGTGDFAGGTDGTLTAQVTGTPPVGQGGAGCAGPDEQATTVAVNLVALEATAGGNLRLSEAGVSPLGGVVNFSSVRINSNEVPVQVGAPGEVDVDVNGGPTGVRAVTVGFWVPGDGTPIVVS